MVGFSSIDLGFWGQGAGAGGGRGREASDILVTVAVNGRFDVFFEVMLKHRERASNSQSVVQQTPPSRARHSNVGKALGFVSYPQEPRSLSIVGTLPTDLQCHPALLQVQLGPTRVAEAVFPIVCVEQVINARRGLPDGDARVRVLDGGDAAVWVNGGVRFLLHGGEVQQRGLVGHPKLLEDDGDFGGVGDLD